MDYPSPVFSGLNAAQTIVCYQRLNTLCYEQHLQKETRATAENISVWIYCFYMWFVFMFKCIDLYFLLTIIVKC